MWVLILICTTYKYCLWHQCCFETKRDHFVLGCGELWFQNLLQRISSSMYLFTISPICIFVNVHRAWLHRIATNLWTTSKLHFPLKNRNQASGRTMWFKEFYNFLKAIIWNWYGQHRFPKHMFIIVFRFILPPSNILFIFTCGTDWLNISLYMRDPFDWLNISLYWID